MSPLDAVPLDAVAVDSARRSFESDGFVFVESVVGAEAIDACRAAVRADLTGEHVFQEFPDVAGIGTSFFDFEGPFADPEIVANPTMLQLLRALLGDEISCSVYNTNVSKPGAARDQPVHVDTASASVEGVPWSRHVSVHITLCEFTEENGSTELWPGTHHLRTDRDADLEAAGAARPSVRANLPPGSLILRDASVWHRGRVNRTGEHREMLSFFVTAKGEPAEGGVYGRPLRIRRALFEALPAAARSMWAVNEIAD